jgi:hypothetical protein
MKPEATLLRRIAAIPADEKLPVSRFARELNCSASVVVAMVQRLIADGRLDAATVRPPVAAAEPSSKDAPTGDTLFAAVCAECQRRQLTRLAASIEIFGHKGQLQMLRGHAPRAKTVARVTEWLERSRRERGPELSKAAADSPAAGCGEADPDRASPPVSPPSLPAKPTGNDLVDAVEAAARRAGVPLHTFIQPLCNDVGKLQQMRVAIRPYARTIERVRALIAGEAVPPAMRERPPTVPQQFVRRSEREAAGLPPSERELRETDTLRAVQMQRAKIDHLRDVNDTRHAQRERFSAEVAEREAMERIARRNQARCTGTVSHPIDLSDALGDTLVDLIDTASDRRARELEELQSPSSVLRRAQRDWPEQCAKVKAIAAELEVTLAEAWHRVIGAGVDCLTDPEAA